MSRSREVIMLLDNEIYTVIWRAVKCLYARGYQGKHADVLLNDNVDTVRHSILFHG